MRDLKLAAFFLLFTVCLTGCTHAMKVRAVTEPASQPAESLGTIEDHLNTNPWAPVNWGSFLKEFFTLSFADTSYKTRLLKKLAKDSKKFNAHQVVNVEFWPDLNSKKFPDGKVFARGEMIRYTRFPQPDAPSQLSPE